MKNLFSLLLCFSLMIFIGHSVNAIERENSPPGISVNYEMESVPLFNIEIKNQEVARVPIYQSKITEGDFAEVAKLRLWSGQSIYVITNKESIIDNNFRFGFDNSLYAYNHLLYETSISKNCNQWTKPVCKHGIAGIETGYEQVSNLFLST